MLVIGIYSIRKMFLFNLNGFKTMKFVFVNHKEAGGAGKITAYMFGIQKVYIRIVIAKIWMRSGLFIKNE